MTLKPADAERLLRARLGEPAKEPTKYVIGFTTHTGKVFAFHRETTETLIWFQPPAPPVIAGVTLLAEGSVAQIACLPRFPFPRTDLSHGFRERYAERCVAVQDGDADLELGDLTVEVPSHEPLAQ